MSFPLKKGVKKIRVLVKKSVAYPDHRISGRIYSILAMAHRLYTLAEEVFPIDATDLPRKTDDSIVYAI